MIAARVGASSPGVTHGAGFLPYAHTVPFSARYLALGMQPRVAEAFKDLGD